MNAKKFSDAMSELDTKYADEALKLKNGLTLSLQGFEPFSGTAAACFENKLIALIQNKENKISPIRVFNL